jgi:hypothetical protein
MAAFFPSDKVLEKCLVRTVEAESSRICSFHEFKSILNKCCRLTRKPDHKIPRGFGLRQPSAALRRRPCGRNSGSGLPRHPLNPNQLAGCSVFEPALISMTRCLQSWFYHFLTEAVPSQSTGNV